MVTGPAISGYASALKDTALKDTAVNGPEVDGPVVDSSALPDGEAELRDSETGAVITVTITPELRRRYQELASARHAELATRCGAHGLRYIRADTTTTVADLLFSPASPLRRPPAAWASARSE